MFFFVKQKTAYDVRISDWSSDVCSSDLDFQARAPGIGQDADQRVDVAMIVGGIERARNVALQSLRQRDQPRELRQRQRLFQPRPRALLKPQQWVVGADQRPRSVDAAGDDAIAHAPPSDRKSGG